MADSHQGDRPGAERSAAIAGMTSLQPHAPAGEPQGHPPEQGRHPVNACHCTHTHTVGLIAVVPGLLSFPMQATGTFPQAGRRVPNGGKEPLFRPPIG